MVFRIKASLNDFLKSHDLFNAFSHMASFSSHSDFTRSDSRSKSILDYVFVSMGLLNQISNVCIGDYHDNFSDHRPVEEKRITGWHRGPAGTLK